MLGKVTNFLSICFNGNLFWLGFSAVGRFAEQELTNHFFQHHCRLRLEERIARLEHFLVATDIQTTLFGQLNQTYGTPAPTAVAGVGWQGPVGYVIE